MCFRILWNNILTFWSRKAYVFAKWCIKGWVTMQFNQFHKNMNQNMNKPKRKRRKIIIHCDGAFTHSLQCRKGGTECASKETIANLWQTKVERVQQKQRRDNVGAIKRTLLKVGVTNNRGKRVVSRIQNTVQKRERWVSTNPTAHI